MKKRNLFRRIVVTIGLLAMIGASACAQETKSTPSASSSPAPASQSSAAAPTKPTTKTVGTELKLGFVNPTSGAQADYGLRMRIAADMAVKEINATGGVNGVPLKVLEADTGSQPQEEARLLQRFAGDDKVLAIFGVLSGDPAMHLPMVSKLRVPLIMTGPVPPAVLKESVPWGFTFATFTTELIRAGIKQAVKMHNPKKLASIYPGDLPNGKVIGENTLQLAKEAGIEALDPIMISFKDTDYTAAVTRLKGQVASQGADMVAIGHSGQGAGVIVAEMRKQGIQIPVLGAYSAAAAGLITSGGQAVEGVIVEANWVNDNPDSLQGKFVKEFEARAQAESVKGPTADYSTAYIYDMVRVLAKTMQDGGISNAPENLAKDRELITKGLLSIKDFPAVGGKISIGENGQTIREVFTAIVKDGKFQMLSRCFPGSC